MNQGSVPSFENLLWYKFKLFLVSVSLVSFYFYEAIYIRYCIHWMRFLKTKMAEFRKEEMSNKTNRRQSTILMLICLLKTHTCFWILAKQPVVTAEQCCQVTWVGWNLDPFQERGRGGGHAIMCPAISCSNLGS